MKNKINETSGVWPNYVPVPEGFQISGPGVPVYHTNPISYAAPIAPPNQQFEAMPHGFWAPDLGLPGFYPPPMAPDNQRFPPMPLAFQQHPPINGNQFPACEIQANYATPNIVGHHPYSGVIPNFGSEQPTRDGLVHGGNQAPYNFVQQAAVMNVQHHYHQSAEETINTSCQRLPVVDRKNQERMLVHIKGHVDLATNVLQDVKTSHAEASQHRERADRIRATIASLGDCTPPRAAHAYKRRLHEQGMSTGIRDFKFKQEDPFGDATQGTVDGTPMGPSLGCQGGHRQPYKKEMTRAQRRKSTLSNSTPRSLSTPVQHIFDTPRTPENFNDTARTKDASDRASPFKRRRTSAGRNTLPQACETRKASPMPIPSAGMLHSMSSTVDSVARAPLASPGPGTASLECVPGPAVILEMSAPNQVMASFKPVAGPPLSYPMPAHGPFSGSVASQAIAPAVFKFGISGGAASASMSGTAQPVSCEMDFASPTAAASVKYNRDPAVPPGAIFNSSALPSSVSNRGFSGQDIDGISSDEVLFPGVKAPFWREPVAAPPASNTQSGIQGSQSTVMEASVQQGFLPAGNVNVRLDVFTDYEFLTPNPLPSNGKNSQGSILDRQEDVNFFDHLDGENDAFGLGLGLGLDSGLDSGLDFGFDDQTWEEQIAELQRHPL